MGLKEKKKPHKEKTKRKRGKKFRYDPQKEQEKVEKHNPFEDFSKKKFIKQNNKFNQLIYDYKTKNNVNSFKDNRIAENSTYLTYDQKMKLRYKAQQMLKNSKKSKFTFENNDDSDNNNNSSKNSEDEDLKLTHKGKEINYEDSDSNNYEYDANEEYYNQMNEYIENLHNNKKLTKQERFKEILQKSKQLKEEKQRIRENTLNKITFLNDNFIEINSLLKKRKRTFNRFNDDYDKMTNNFIYSERTHPTERVKSKEEIEEEKEKKLKKIEIQRLKEEVDEEEESYDDDKKIEDSNEKHLTKKERIEKLIQERLGKAKKKMEKRLINENINLKEEEENENGDNLSDLNEIEQERDNEEEEEDEEEIENDENESKSNNGKDDGEEDDENHENEEQENINEKHIYNKL